MLFGAHMPTGGGLWRALERGAALGCDVVQLFVKNNMQWLGKSPAENDIAQFLGLRESHDFACVFAHAGYLINLAAPSSPNRDKSIESLILEIQIASALGLPFIVLHPGAHLGTGDAAGLASAAQGLDQVLKATRAAKVRIALENTAGQGTCLGHRLEHLHDIIHQCQYPDRLLVCLDTAHFFAAGFEIHTPKGWERTILEVDRLVGLDRVAAFHLNDSKVDFGSHIDRHAGIGQGKIGKAAFRHIVNDPRFNRTPGCLETPKSPDLHEDVENLAILRGLTKSSRSRTPSKARHP